MNWKEKRYSGFKIGDTVKLVSYWKDYRSGCIDGDGGCCNNKGYNIGSTYSITEIKNNGGIELHTLNNGCNFPKYSIEKV